MIATSRSTISCITRQIGGPASCHVNERFIDYTITIFIHIYIYICAIPSIIVCINLLDLEKSYNFILRSANKHILISETTSLSKNPFDNSKLSPNSIDPFTEGVSNIDDSTLSNSLKNFVDLIYI